jgi:hypothetical protein
VVGRRHRGRFGLAPKHPRGSRRRQMRGRCVERLVGGTGRGVRPRRSRYRQELGYLSAGRHRRRHPAAGVRTGAGSAPRGLARPAGRPPVPGRGQGRKGDRGERPGRELGAEAVGGAHTDCLASVGGRRARDDDPHHCGVFCDRPSPLSSRAQEDRRAALRNPRRRRGGAHLCRRRGGRGCRRHCEGQPADRVLAGRPPYRRP